MEEFEEGEYGIEFPLPAFLVALGFLVTYGLELAVHAVVAHGGNHRCLAAAMAAHNHPEGHDHDHHHDHATEASHPSPSDGAGAVTANGHREEDMESGSQTTPTTTAQHAQEEGREAECTEEELTLTRQALSWASGLVFHLALSYHSILEGIALGVQSTDVGTTSILIAILAHKSLAAFALGQKLMLLFPTLGRLVWVLLASFLLTTPVGIAIGMGISELHHSLTLIIIEALAGGAFIYVGIVEMLVRDLEVPSTWSPLALWAWALGGFGIMSLLALWA